MCAMDVYAVLPIVTLSVLAIRWGWALVKTRDKPADWVPPRYQTWPLRVGRDGYRRLLAVSLVCYAIGIGVFAWLAVVRART